jgi:hypothetical protein
MDAKVQLKMQLRRLVMVRHEEWFVSVMNGWRQRTMISELMAEATAMADITQTKGMRGASESNFKSV